LTRPLSKISGYATEQKRRPNSRMKTVRVLIENKKWHVLLCPRCSTSAVRRRRRPSTTKILLLRIILKYLCRWFRRRCILHHSHTWSFRECLCRWLQCHTLHCLSHTHRYLRQQCDSYVKNKVNLVNYSIRWHNMLIEI